MKLSDQVYMVGSGKFGLQLSHSMDCNVYLVDGGHDQYALIDAGGGMDPEQIIQNIEQEGVRPDQIKYLLLTHAHGDHAAGSAFFSNQYGIEVIASKEIQPWVESGDQEKSSLAPAKKAGIYPEDFQFPRCKVSKGVVENDTIHLGNMELKVLETPGHSQGHISFLLEQNGKKMLFSGDALFAGGKIVLQNIWDCSIQDYARTLSKLGLLRIDTLFPGHGVCLMKEAWKHVDIACGYFERLEVPPNL
ncbi:MBL fold metallo-hydrolase [Paenibacillus koleovorans]|uniref:MBL fold metallo-hydrolase n=1 Tax=Paenibacillus koleovorans TaxID=121608 RepID=UPI000FDB903A|nr:MBL fold metallo-hydrolase [Paenibacillus koleovorans]